jgi:hypothetical protein
MLLKYYRASPNFPDHSRNLPRLPGISRNFPAYRELSEKPGQLPPLH